MCMIILIILLQIYYLFPLQAPLPISPSGEEFSPPPEEVSLRPAPRRLVKNRYSLIRAFSDPLDEVSVCMHTYTCTYMYSICEN